MTKKKKQSESLITKCRVCGQDYEKGRRKCTACGAPNLIWQSDTFVVFEIEIERELYNAIQAIAVQKGVSTDSVVSQGMEYFITEVNTGRIK